MSDDTQDLNEIYPGAGTFQFGHTKVINERQLKMVRNKKKTAMSAPYREFVDDMDSMPMVGRCDIAANWDGSPALVIKTRVVRKVRFDEVTVGMAKAEGEKTLELWRAHKQAYLEKNGGFKPSDVLVFEHFEMIEDLSGLAIADEEENS